MSTHTEVFNIGNDSIIQKKIKKSSVNIVIDNIKNLIISKKFIPGDRIPNESELSEAMGFSRGTIREALKILEAFKIVDIRRGDGTYISTSINEALLDPLLFSLIASEPELKELVELREMFELEIVKLIIKNADSSDINRIYKTCAEMKNYVDSKERDSETLLKCDLAFHEALGKATKNILVSNIYDFVMRLFSPRIQRTHEKKENPKRALQNHTDIYEALYARDMKRATKSIEESIEAWKELSD
jgi:DNA-binding FadR family transcriptional regulator